MYLIFKKQVYIVSCTSARPLGTQVKILSRDIQIFNQLNSTWWVNILPLHIPMSPSHQESELQPSLGIPITAKPDRAVLTFSDRNHEASLWQLYNYSII